MNHVGLLTTLYGLRLNILAVCAQRATYHVVSRKLAYTDKALGTECVMCNIEHSVGVTQNHCML